MKNRLLFKTGKAITVQLPAEERKPGMQLYSGERMPDGSINWVNPVPIENTVIPVALHTLNFYPEKFLPVLQELGFDITNKKITDSIYFSYSGRKNSYYSESNKWWGEIDGQNLFKQNCSSCHSASDQKGSGPGLASVLWRIPGGDWKYKFVRNSAALAASGDSYTQQIKREWNNAAMTGFPTLTNEEIDAILNYASSAGAKTQDYQIDPALVAPLGESQYEGTLIATKEFEKRLRVIFQIGTPEILSLYVNNLDKSFRYIDSLVMTGFPEAQTQFNSFYLLNEGKVEISTELSRQLQRRYEARSKAVRETAEKVYGRKMQQQAAEDSLQYAIINQEINSRFYNLIREYSINLNNVYDQLGYVRVKSAPSYQSSYNTAISGNGWNNIDKQVFDITTKRNSGEIVDPVTGKTAKLTYSDFKAVLNESSRFAQLRIYLVSDSLPSYMRLTQNENEFAEKLNDLLLYNLVMIGKKDNKWYYFESKDISPGTLSINPSPISPGELSINLNRLKPKSAQLQFDLEIKAIELEETASLRMQIREKQKTRDEAIMKAIFSNYVPFNPPEVFRQ
ncbi:MAG: cytochrome c [Bacteroidia bacterium]|jgi:mono/diheme cytochrome c family protein|nr:cytochrome c [Bacteroidia bacterium]